MLIHIGLHKTGTTWLQQSIFGAADSGFVRVWPPTIVDDAFLGGNPYSFDAKYAASLIKPFIAQADAARAVPVITHEPLSGRLILNGFDSKTLADRLHATFPDAKILLVIREQRAMMASIYKQYVRTIGTLPPQRYWGEYSPEERRNNPVPGLEVFEYHRLIEYYQKLFGKDHVLVLAYEQLRDDPVEFVGRIRSFAGLDAVPAVPVDPENVALAGAIVPFVRYLNVVLRALGLLGPFGGPVRNGKLRNGLHRMYGRLSSWIPSALSQPYDKRLRKIVDGLGDERFARSNAITAELTGLDLKGYGYE